jgi:uncharacterized membrane protein YeaQ/YmgE (transglycosylase-associated protein family)
VLSWLLFGLVVGAIAKYLMPGRDPPGCIITIALGIAGALLGGAIGSWLGWGGVRSNFEPRSLALAVCGAMALLLLGRFVFANRRRRNREWRAERDD